MCGDVSSLSLKFNDTTGREQIRIQRPLIALHPAFVGYFHFCEINFAISVRYVGDFVVNAFMRGGKIFDKHLRLYRVRHVAFVLCYAQTTVVIWMHVLLEVMTLFLYNSSTPYK